MERNLLRGRGAEASEPRREGAHDRHEAREDDRAAAVLLEESVSALQVFLFEKARIFALEESGPDMCAEPVAHRVADNRGGDDEEDKRPESEEAGSREKSCGEEERITGKEDADEKAALGEDD